MFSGLVTEYLLPSSKHNMHSLHYHCCSIRQVSNSNLILLQMNDDYKIVNNTFQISVKEITSYTLFQIKSFFYCTASSTSTLSSGAHLGLICPAKGHFHSSVSSDLIYVTTGYIYDQTVSLCVYHLQQKDICVF
jgi:hypothetical protein